MKLSVFKAYLSQCETFDFALPDGSYVPAHFHITEMGVIQKKYTDCGNTYREDHFFTFQLWYSTDVSHRLTAQKVLKIIKSIEQTTAVGDFEIQVEYQEGATIGKFGLDFNGTSFELLPTRTTCLAQDNCGIPVEKVKRNLNEITACCTAESGCC